MAYLSSHFPNAGASLMPLSSTIEHGSTLRWLCLVVVSIVFSVGYAAEAKASCGDHLQHALLTRAAIVLPVGDRPADGSSGSLPCSGPSCQQGPEGPQKPAPAGQPTSNSERFALCMESILPSALKASTFHSGIQFLVQEGYSISLERPPQQT